MKIFVNVKEWWLYVKSAAIHLAKGIARIVYAVVIGVVSVIVWLWRLLVGWVCKYPTSAISTALVVFLTVITVLYASYRARIVTTEHELDSVKLRMEKWERMYDGNTDSLIVVRKDINDTLTFTRRWLK
jgi:uncharacterized membrane protein